MRIRTKLSKVVKSGRFVIGLSFIVGALVILGIRFVTYHPPDEVHYHANFAVYFNGQRELFKDIFYYIGTEGACSLEPKMTPHQRAHMHDNVNDVVHVEDQAVTWGVFFQNIGWVVDATLIKTADQILLADPQNKITFMLNGEQTDKIVNRVIKDQDRLLVDYGSTSPADLHKEYESVPTTARQYNMQQDPASCSGRRPTNLSERFKHLF
ncbi:hypothetical protein HYW36_02450 [Candidatus Saccharibacteria bacterium]|nr:hypothetical protein [Candidatus Saccharibacteria bacterium]